MEECNIQTKQYNVPVEATLEVIGGKWKVVILCLLKEGTKRFGELHRYMPNASKKMLTQQLRELEEDGLVNRVVSQQVPLKVEYSLSEEGESLRTILNLMCEWGERVSINKMTHMKNSPSHPHWEIDGESSDKRYNLLTSFVFFSVLGVVYDFNDTRPTENGSYKLFNV